MTNQPIILANLEQGTDEWLEARRGIVTAGMRLARLDLMADDRQSRAQAGGAA